MQDLKEIVTNVGAFAGFAAVVGLAVLAMLYFSQARDVRRLREWAGRAPERDAEVEQLAQQIASQAIADTYAAMPAMGQVQAAAQPLVEQSGEPPGESAEWSPDQPEATDADQPAEIEHEGVETDQTEPAEDEPVTELEPSAEPAGEEAEEPALPAAAAAAAALSQPTVEIDVLGLDDEPAVPAETRPSRLAPSTPAAARAGHAPAPPSVTGVSGPPPPLPPLEEYRSTAAESLGAGGYATTAHTGETTFSEFEIERNRAERRSSGSRAPFYIAGVLLLAFGALLVYTQVGGNDTTKPDTTKQSEAQRRAATGSNPRINRAAVQVVVLNGTNISGLAAVVGDQVDQAGFTLKSVANRGDNQEYIKSTVYYTAGKKPEAEEVAKELQIDSVKQVDAATAAAGGNAPVIVVTGSDREQ